MSSATVQCLERVRELIADVDSWIQGMWARSGFESVPPHDPNATCFCLRGAIERAAHDHIGTSTLIFDEVYWDIYQAIDTQIQRQGWRQNSVVPYNDHPGRRHAEVLAVVDAAIVRSRADQERRELEDFERAMA
jgi:hypothetical protein